jgi:hypothetical protein
VAHPHSRSGGKPGRGIRRGKASLGGARRVEARQAWQVPAWQVPAWHGGSGLGKARQATRKESIVAKKAEAVQAVRIPKLNIQMMTVKLVGDSPLISHKWSDKAKKEMLDKQMKVPKDEKAAKDPQRDYEESLYHTPSGGFGFPSTAFKSAAVDACSHVDGITKVEARGAFHVAGELVAINGQPRMREDMVRVGMGTADLRYRGEFPEWSAVLSIRFNASVLKPDQIVHLFNVAGFAIGVGEWRPQRDGSYGMFHVAQGGE